jgi:predicted transcriptional regulator
MTKKQPTTKAGKLLRKILDLLRKESVEHVDVLLKKMTDEELQEIAQELKKEMVRRNMLPFILKLWQQP